MNKETDSILESLKASGTHEIDLPYIEVKGDSITIDGSLNVDDLRIIVSELDKQKSRTKAEFVRCEYSREWKAVRHYNEVGELFVVDWNGNYTNVNDISGAWYEVVCKNYKELYIKVETEIDECQEFIEVAKELIDGSKTAEYSLGAMFDSGKFKLVE